MKDKKNRKNKHGLSRDIPDPIQQQIRLQSGFGCVICGIGIYTYEHVDPLFAEALEHDPSKMTLLCFGCHGKVSTGMWSKQKVKDAMLNPKALTNGYSSEAIDIGNGHPKIELAGNVSSHIRIPLMVNNLPLIEIKPSSEERGRFLLSARFYNSRGIETLSIIDNVWSTSTGNWDVEVVGRVIRIREGKGKVALQLTAKPPDTLAVTRINMLYKGKLFKGTEEKLQIIDPSTGVVEFTFKNVYTGLSHIGFRFEL